MDITIYIDVKEDKKFIEILQNHMGCIPKSLDIGDIAFYCQDKPILIIERKTINDLASSLNDGRYKEQKIRLMSINNSSRIIYLIEGSYDMLNIEYHKSFNVEKYKGCIINTIIRDNIHVYHTENMEESAQFIYDIKKRLPKYIDVLVNNKISDYSNIIKIKKKDNLTAKICFINQLRQIPGVSISIAEKLVELYHNMNNFVMSVKNEDTLKNIKVGNRKIGPVLSKRFYEYLYGK